MTPDLDHWVNEAVGCFNSDGSISGKEISKFNKLLQLIVEEWAINNGDFAASDKYIKHTIRGLLRELRNSLSPVKEFHNNRGKIQRELGTEPHTHYTITFPLNIKFQNWSSSPNKFTIRGRTIEKVERNEWRRKYWSSIKHDKNVRWFLEKSPNDIPSLSMTYWKMEVNGLDQRYAIDLTQEIIDLLCAKINFALKFDRVLSSQTGTGPWPYRWSQLRSPFIFFLFKDGLHLGFYKDYIYDTYYYSNDPEPRKTVRINSFKRDRFKNIFPELPNFSKKIGDVDQTLIDGFYLYQSGISESKNRDAFLNYWRGIEIMTLTNKDERMTEIPKRVQAILHSEDPKTFDYRLERVRLLRNELVHKGRKVTIEKDDLSLLKKILESLVMLYIDFRDRWDLEDFSFVLKQGGKDISKINDMKKEKHREIYLLHEVAKFYRER